MDYREQCECGGSIETANGTPDEIRHMANIWRKYHVCHGSRLNRETGEIEPEAIDQALSRWTYERK